MDIKKYFADLKTVFESRKIKIALCVILIIIAVLLIFQAGMFVGFKKAGFSYQWGENYARNFAGPRGGIINDMRGGDFMGAHGVFGEIIKNDNTSLIIKGEDGTERAVSVGADTLINKFKDKIAVGDLKINDRVSVIGAPNSSGQIEAKLIRVLPAMPFAEPPFRGQFPPIN